MNGTIYTLYFSPTHTSRAVARAIAQGACCRLGKPVQEIDWTLPADRNTSKTKSFCKEDLLIFAFPVYAGRIPVFLDDILKTLQGEETPAIVAAVYGNRDYDDALLEACDLLKTQNFLVCAAGAFIGEHSLSRAVATSRPDKLDLQKAEQFGEQVASKLFSRNVTFPEPKGQRPYKARGENAPVTPKTTSSCNQCGLCVHVCPMGAIDSKDPKNVADSCIHCCACVKQCPQNAKRFTNPKIIAVKTFLETTCKKRKEPEFFL